MANSLSHGHTSPRSDWSASCSSHCSLGTRWRESRTGCPAFLSKFIVIEEKIKREFSRLKRIFKDLDKNKLQTVESLIKNAAFMAVSLEELQEIINEEGYTVEYQNGANQSGTKQSDAVKTHIAMTKNHAAIIKQLCDLVPPEKKKESRLQALRDE